MERVFCQVLSLFTKADAGDVLDKVEISEALDMANRLENKVSELNLFSLNESISDLSTKDLKYLLVNFFRGYFSSREYISIENRIDSLRNSLKFFKSFLDLVSLYDCIDLNSRLLEKCNFNNQSSVQLSREEKIQLYKEKISLKQKLDNYNLAFEGDTDDDIHRDLIMQLIQYCVRLTLEECRLIRQEIDLLQLHKDRPNLTETIQEINPSLNTTQEKQNYLLTPSGKPLQPFTIISRKDQIKNLFRPGHRLPSMTIDEYLEIEKKRGGIISGGNAAKNPSSATIDDLDYDALDKETMKQREWDEFKEQNPRGWGNRMNKG